MKCLNYGKSGECGNVTSDNIINGTQLLYYYISVLFNVMLIHGVFPEEFLISISISIPKCSSLFNSFNIFIDLF